MGIKTSALRHGSLTGQGAGAAWKAVGTARSGNRALRLPPTDGRLTGAASGPRSKRVSAYGHGDRHVSLPPIARPRMYRRAAAWPSGRPQVLTRGGALVARLAHTQEAGRSIRPSATNIGQAGHWRAQGAVNAPPLAVAVQLGPCPPRGLGILGFDSPSPHQFCPNAQVAQW